MLQGISSGINNISNIGQNAVKVNPTNALSARIYARKGEPTYDMEMDLDNDGKITFDEFKQYCEDNNINEAQRQEMMQRWSDWQLFKSRSQYAKEGDMRYDKEMDINSDGTVDYDEYLRYQEEREASKEDKSEKKLTPIEKAYMQMTEEEPSQIVVEA